MRYGVAIPGTTFQVGCAGECGSSAHLLCDVRLDEAARQRDYAQQLTGYGWKDPGTRRWLCPQCQGDEQDWQRLTEKVRERALYESSLRAEGVRRKGGR